MGRTQSPETRAKISASLLGKYKNRLGHKNTLEHNQKIGDAHRGKKRQHRVFSDLHRARLSASQIGKQYSAKSRAKMSVSQQIRFSKPEERLKIKVARANQIMHFPFGNTKPECTVQKWLESNGLEFETQFRVGMHSFDLAIPKIKTLIEVDGCYWHRCPTHFPRGHFKDTSVYDQRATFENWSVLHLWEHDIPLLQELASHHQW